MNSLPGDLRIHLVDKNIDTLCGLASSADAYVAARAHDETNHITHQSAMPRATPSAAASITNKHCVFCDRNNHFSDECQTHLTHEARMKKMYGRCIKCLKFGHNAATCSRTKPCFYCKASTHHGSLCKSRQGNQATNRSKTPTTTTVMTVIGDVLIVSMMDKIGFTNEEYAKRHHGGYLGAKSRYQSKQ